MDKNKMTIVEMYDATMALLNGESVDGFTIEDAVAFLDGRKEQTIKKNAKTNSGERKLTPTQIENEKYKDTIVAILQGSAEPMAMADIRKADPILSAMSTQKIGGLLTRLKAEGVATYDTVKGRNLWKLI